jgi:D-glycero-alpha-D-manno-heptose-7-phosphate kinase
MNMIRISCPARIDIGNRLDYPSYFLSMPVNTAKTANIAIELRTSISYTSNPQNGVSFLTDNIVENHSGSPDPGKSQFPLLSALVQHFGINSGTFHVRSEVPRGSGLGGSGMLAVAAISLIRKLRLGSISDHDFPSLLLVAHFLENWLGFASTGFQDQLAALYGGANLWTWGTHLDQLVPIYMRSEILPSGGSNELSKHILVCFTGEPHPPSGAGSQFKRLTALEIAQWSRVSRCTEDFSRSVQASDWSAAAHHLNAECDIRTEIDSGCLSSRAKLLVESGRICGSGCRFAGHGHGGCVWAIGSDSAIRATDISWRTIVQRWKGAWLVRPKVASHGLLEEVVDQSAV